MRLALVIALYATYILAFNLLEMVLGTITGIFVTLPVLMTAWMFGLRGRDRRRVHISPLEPGSR